MSIQPGSNEGEGTEETASGAHEKKGGRITEVKIAINIVKGRYGK